MRIKIDKADREFGFFIKARDHWMCQRCGAQHEEGSSGIHCSHFWGRGKENTRFDEENCDSICFGCHNFFHAHPEEHRRWKLKQLGEKGFRDLEIRAHMIGSRSNRGVIYIYYKKQNETNR